MKSVRHLAAIAAIGLLAIAGSASAAPPTPGGSDSPGLGGAGAFIPPAHVNGIFGAGGPCAGIGGAGAFIPSTVPATCHP